MKFKGFIDIVFVKKLKRKTVIYIADFKTCQWGWPAKKFQDIEVISQLLLYKHFFCKLTGADPRNVTHRLHPPQEEAQGRKDSLTVDVEVAKISAVRRRPRRPSSTCSGRSPGCTGTPTSKNSTPASVSGSTRRPRRGRECPFLGTDLCPGSGGPRPLVRAWLNERKRILWLSDHPLVPSAWDPGQVRHQRPPEDRRVQFVPRRRDQAPRLHAPAGGPGGVRRGELDHPSGGRPRKQGAAPKCCSRVQARRRRAVHRPTVLHWVWEMEDEVRQVCPIVYWHVWDNDPVPEFNRPIYEATDYIMALSLKTYGLLQGLGHEGDASATSHTRSRRTCSSRSPELRSARPGRSTSGRSQTRSSS
jgi:hypothetical protein